MVSRTLLVLAIFAGMVPPVWAQTIEKPIDSGIVLPPDTPDRYLCRTVYSDGDFQYDVHCSHFGAVDWSTSLVVVTGGPSTQVTVTVPLSTFGLFDSDRVVTTVDVQHLGGSTSGQSTQELISNPVDSNSTSMLHRVKVGRLEPV